ncbi:HAD-IIB family hydrolase [Candidatus Microgenomates bacterium]|nr:HAD-IIB family hydrolase [Candidatus Microgenomates bacterium]
MKYKALILDIDGTLIPNKREGMPSEKVTQAIAKASEYIHVGVATSRPLFIVEHIAKHLKLSGPSIINGGAQIIDIATNRVFYRQPMEKEDVLKVTNIAKQFNLSINVDTDKQVFTAQETMPSEDVLGMWVSSLDEKTAQKLRKAINTISTVSAHLIPSWTSGKWVVSVSHAKATKQQAVFEIAKVLDITTNEIIGMGDGYNDFPLLMACGLKVAMGNAVSDLKEIADYIAPSVEKDGVANVINRFVLN